MHLKFGAHSDPGIPADYSDFTSVAVVLLFGEYHADVTALAVVSDGVSEQVHDYLPQVCRVSDKVFVCYGYYRFQKLHAVSLCQSGND